MAHRTQGPEPDAHDAAATDETSEAVRRWSRRQKLFDLLDIVVPIMCVIVAIVTGGLVWRHFNANLQAVCTTLAPCRDYDTLRVYAIFGASMIGAGIGVWIFSIWMFFTSIPREKFLAIVAVIIFVACCLLVGGGWTVGTEFR